MVRLFRLILSLTGKFGFVALIALGIISGLSSFMFITVTTRVIGLISKGQYTDVSIKQLAVFLAIILLIVTIRKILSLAIIKLSQTIFWGLRKKILSIVLKANYQQFLSRKTEIHSSVLGDVYVLTDASMSIIGFSTSIILSLSCFIYLAWLSMLLFLITLVTTLAGVIIYNWTSAKYNRDFKKARDLENNFVESFQVLLNGFKEIYMEPAKGQYLYNEKISKISDQAYKHSTAGQIRFLNNQITGQILFYLLITSILLIFSVTLHIDFVKTISFVFALSYLLGSVETIMILLPNLVRAKVAANHLMDLTEDLENTDFNNTVANRKISKDQLEIITVRGLEFSYGKSEDRSFCIGPVDFDIAKGDIVFIYGDNGSGKTTFVQSLLGLRTPTAGEIRLNDVVIDGDNYLEYRTAFSVVFSDFYLFNEIMVPGELNIEKWNYYLHLFELEDKVKLDGKSFSTTALSTGQRKRLALISQLMEEKPVIVLDEWAADQDPYFRKKFYTEIIAALKEEGFTIIAITHDDKYYHCADRLYRMDFGKLLCESDISLPLNGLHK